MEIGNIESWKRASDPSPKSGQGEVRRVTRVGDTDGALYVLKSMHPGQARRPERQERFKREIEALRKLDDPHILKIVDYGYDERGAPYLVTPFCENGTLENLPAGTVTDTVRRFLGICLGGPCSVSLHVVPSLSFTQQPSTLPEQTMRPCLPTRFLASTASNAAIAPLCFGSAPHSSRQPSNLPVMPTAAARTTSARAQCASPRARSAVSTPCRRHPIPIGPPLAA